METLGFLKIKIEETKGVWDNFFFTYETLGFKKKLKLKKTKEFGITSFSHMKLWVFKKN
jgi:hypothetical protein